MQWVKTTVGGTDNSITYDVIGTIGDSNTAAITNGLTGKLTVGKTQTKSGNGTIPGAKSYSYTVTLANIPSGSYTYYVNGMPQTLGNGNTLTFSINGSTESTTTDYTAPSTVITGIPYGTTVSVAETNPNDGSRATYKVNSEATAHNGYTASSVTIGSTAQNVAFTNTYPDATALSLKKVVTGELPASMGADPKFIYTVTLKSGTSVNIASYLNQITLPNGSYQTNGTAITDGSKLSVVTPNGSGEYIFDVAVPVYQTDSDIVSVTGLPLGISYTVAEKLSGGQPQYYKKNGASYETTASIQPSGIGWSRTGENLSGTDITTGQTAVVTNAYPTVGSLVLTKSVHGGGNADPAVDNSTPFYFKVELTNDNTNGIDLREYVLASAITGIEEQSLQAHNCTFYVPVYNGTNKTISNIPVGTSYNVTEVYKRETATLGTYEYVAITNDPKHQQVSYSPDTQPGTADTITAAPAVNQVTVTNTYRKITLTKTDSVDNDHLVAGAVYKLYKVNEPGQIDLTDLSTLGTVVRNADDTADWTGTTNASGQIIVRDADVYGGLSDGNYVFIEQSAPTGYSVNNDLTGKVITVNSTNDGTAYAYTVGHTDIRDKVSLTLQKQLASGTDAATYGSTPFTYTVTLTAHDDGVHLKDFIPVVNESETKTVAGVAVNSITVDTNSEISFTVSVTANSNISFNNLPYGTKYTVTESVTGTWKQTASSNTSDSTGMTANATASFTNANTGSLALEKELESNTPADKDYTGKASTDDGYVGPLNKDQQFSYTVTLITPDGVVLDTSAHGLTLTNGSFANNEPTVVTEGSGATQHSKVTFTVTNVSKANTVTVSGVPSGTTYYVTENALSTTLTDRGWYKVTQSTTANTITYDQTGSIGEDASTATITNGLLGGLTVSKNRQAYVGTAPDESFGLKVTFTNLPSSGYSIKKDGSAISLANDGSYTFTLNSSNNYSASFTDIPVGVSYEVTEPSVPTNWEKTGDSNVSGTISVAGSSASITNKYRPSGTLKVKKALDGEYNKFKDTSNNTIGDTTTFPITIELNAPSSHTWSEYTAVGYPNGHAPTSSTTKHTFTLQWSVHDGDFEITNVPYGSTYTITESALTYDNGVCTTTVPAADTSFTWDSGNTTTKTETVTNDYAEKGQLSVSKIAETAPGSTEPGSYPNATFHVELKLKSGADWLLPSGMTITEIKTSVNTTDPKVYAFDVSVPANGSAVVVASNIPKSEVLYKVTEASVPDITGYTSSKSDPVNSSTPDGNGFAEITDGNLNASVSITNTYTQVGSLTLNKVKADTGNTSSQTEFDMNVVLTPPGTMTAAELKAYSNDLSSFTPDDSSTPKKLTGTVQVTAGTPVTLSNIPYGTKVDVIEADDSQDKTSAVEYSTTAADSGYSTTSVTNLEMDGNKSVFVRNTYP